MGRRDLHPVMIRAQHSTQSAAYFQLHCGVCPDRIDGLALASRHLGAVPSSSRRRESTAGLLPFRDVNVDEQDVDHKQGPAPTLLSSQGEFGDKARSSFHSTLMLLHFRLALAGTCRVHRGRNFSPLRGAQLKNRRILRFHHLLSTPSRSFKIRTVALSSPNPTSAISPASIFLE